MTQRLPIVGSDDDTWGTILNNFLEVSLNSDGTLNPVSVVNAAGGTLRLDQLALPTSSINYNSQKITGLANGVLSSDAATVGQLGQVPTITTKGDLLTSTGSGLARLGVGSDGSLLFADSSQATGLNWGNFITGYAAQENLGLRRANGTSGAPSAVNNGQILGSIGFGGQYDTVVGHFNNNMASIYANAEENYGSSTGGTSLHWKTTPIGSTTPLENMRLSAAGDWSLPTSSVINGNSLQGGVIRQISGLITNSTYTQTIGATAGRVAAGSNGVNISSFTGSGVVNVDSTSGSPASGTISFYTNALGSVFGTATYTGITSTSYTGVNTTSGSGTLVSGTTVVKPTVTMPDNMIGSQLIVQNNQTLGYTVSAGALFGPQPYTSYVTALGLTYPRAIVELEGTFTTKQGISNLYGLAPAFQNAMNYKNDPTTSAAIVNGEGFVNTPNIVADHNAISFVQNPGSNNAPGGGQGWSIGFWDGPAYGAIDSIGGGSPSLSNIQQVGYVSAAFFTANTSAIRRYGILIQDAQTGLNTGGAGSLTTQVGLLIGNLASDGVTLNPFSGATTNIGILNASTTVNTPSTAQTLTASTTVSSNATTVQITAASLITSTATPAISAGQNGQELYMINTGSNAITFQSNNTLAGSNLSLGSTTRIVGAKGSLTLVYNTTLSRWVEVGFNAGGNG